MSKLVALYYNSLVNGPVEQQRHDLRSQCQQHRDWRVTEFVETRGAVTLDHLLGAVRKGQFNVVCVWRYSSLARSTHQLVKTLLEFQSLKVDFVSHCEGIDTTAGPSSRTELFTFLQGLAQLEQDVMRSRWPFTTNRERARQQAEIANLAEAECAH